jgi:hypothetical protein
MSVIDHPWAAASMTASFESSSHQTAAAAAASSSAIATQPPLEIQLNPSPKQPEFNIIVKSLNGDLFQVDCWSQDTVGELKERIAELCQANWNQAEPIHPSQIDLVDCGVDTDLDYIASASNPVALNQHDKTLAFYQVKPGAVLMMVLNETVCPRFLLVIIS